jgi:hypothetical protein
MERLLRTFVNARDRETIAGDLLEEYREVVLPARGRLRAQMWYLRQAISFIEGVRFGLLVGIVFGTWNLISTWLDPLADDSHVMLTFFGPMMLAWGIAGFISTWRSGRLTTGIRVGATVGLVAFVVFDIANGVRVNWFLDSIRYRADWQGLVQRFEASGSTNFRAFANLEYITGTHITLVVASVVGAVAGFVGAIAARAGTRMEQEIRRVRSR